MNSGVAPPLASFILRQCSAEMLRKRARCCAMLQFMMQCNALLPNRAWIGNRRIAAMSILSRIIINLNVNSVTPLPLNE
jgi:hypothetical protein